MAKEVVFEVEVESFYQELDVAFRNIFKSFLFRFCSHEPCGEYGPRTDVLGPEKTAHVMTLNILLVNFCEWKNNTFIINKSKKIHHTQDNSHQDISADTLRKRKKNIEKFIHF